MKTIKIFLAVIVLTTIGIFLLKWLNNDLIILPPVPLPKNVYNEEIQKKIDSLSKAPSNAFCQNQYKDIKSGIEEFHKNGSLGKKSVKEGKIWKEIIDQNNNDQWKEILSKNLYSAYSQKFKEQTNFIFDGNLWRNDDLSFIRIELRELSNSPYLNANNTTTDSFNSIKAVLVEYDQINEFIISCNNFEYNDLELENNYPDVSGMLNKSKSYGINGFSNSKLFNCKRLIDGINNIPSVLFTKHVKYLTNKINTHAPLYKNFKSQAEYIQNIYNTLEDQVEALTNDFYKIDENVYNKNFNEVKNTLLLFNKEAYIYFRNK